MNEFLYGSIGGMTGTILSHPFDTIRVNLQAKQQFPIISNPLNFCKFLYKGVSAPIFGITLEKTIIFGVYDKVLQKTNNPLVAGYMSGVASVFFVTPIEKYKIHYQTTTNTPFPYNNLFRGFLPTMFREPPGYLIYFHTYNKLSNEFEKTLISPFLYGGLAGCTSWLFIYPADIIKTYQQKYDTLSYKEIHKQIMKLKYRYYTGFSMALLRAFPLHGGVFLGYEIAKSLF